MRRSLRRLGRVELPVVTGSGLMEWSDRELARLHPSWLEDFLRRHRHWKRLLWTVMAVALASGGWRLAVSVDGFVRFLQTTQAVAAPAEPPPLKVVNPWTEYCRQRPWLKSCKVNAKPLARKVGAQ